MNERREQVARRRCQPKEIIVAMRGDHKTRCRVLRSDYPQMPSSVHQLRFFALESIVTSAHMNSRKMAPR